MPHRYEMFMDKQTIFVVTFSVSLRFSHVSQSYERHSPLHHITQVAVGKRTHVNVLGNDYPTVDGTGCVERVSCVSFAFCLFVFAGALICCSEYACTCHTSRVYMHVLTLYARLLILFFLFFLFLFKRQCA
jgi:hypothetical protein